MIRVTNVCDEPVVIEFEVPLHPDGRALVPPPKRMLVSGENFLLLGYEPGMKLVVYPLADRETQRNFMDGSLKMRLPMGRDGG